MAVKWFVCVIVVVLSGKLHFAWLLHDFCPDKPNIAMHCGRINHPTTILHDTPNQSFFPVVAAVEGSKRWP